MRLEVAVAKRPLERKRESRATMVVGTPREKTVEEVKQQTVADFITTAMNHYKTINNAESQLRQRMKDDAVFARDPDNAQWDPEIKKTRQTDGRPCLTINRLPQFIRQVTNQERASKPAIQVSPVDNASDRDTAEVFEGLIRRIEANSDADVAYFQAADDAATMGRGYWRVHVDWKDEQSYEQEITIEWIPNPLAVYVDVTTRKPGDTDAKVALIVEDIPENEYVLRWPHSSMASLTAMGGTGNAEPDWKPTGKVRVAEYFYEDREPVDLLLLEDKDGQRITAYLDDYDTLPEAVKASLTEVERRPSYRRVIKWAIINALEILEGNDDLTEGRTWLGNFIPIVPCIGEMVSMDGKIDYRGMVRDAKDPQRRYNFQVSAQTEIAALMPKAPWVGYAGQFEGHETKWNLANRRSFPYLEVNAKSIGGKPAPFPQRQVAEPPIQAIGVLVQQADNDLKATTGFYDASLGERGPQESGKAIRARQQQGEMGNSNYMHNLSRAIRQTGRILVDLIPKVYDEPRIRRILGRDDSPKTVLVHAKPERAPEQKPDGVQGIYNLGVGRYDVTVSSGPSYAAQRQEAAESMQEFVKAFPNVFPLIGDLLVDSLDWPGAKKVAKRLEHLRPPGVGDEEEGKEMPPAAQRQIQQMGQQLEHVSQQFEQAKKMIETDQIKAQMQAEIKQSEQESKERIAMFEARLKRMGEDQKAQVDLIKVRAQIDAKATADMIKAEFTEIEHNMDRRFQRLMAQEERAAQPKPEEVGV